MDRWRLRCSSECKIELEDARTREAINWAMQEGVVMSPASKKERNCIELYIQAHSRLVAREAL
jgi:hypothetical protein